MVDPTPVDAAVTALVHLDVQPDLQSRDRDLGHYCPVEVLARVVEGLGIGAENEVFPEVQHHRFIVVL